MKKLYLILVICLGVFEMNLPAQNAPEIIWTESLGGSNVEKGLYHITTGDGGYILTGESRSDNGDLSENNGDYDYWIVKVDESGEIQWENSFGGSARDRAYCVKPTPDGGYAIFGNTMSDDGDVSENFGSTDFWLIKLDGLGNLIWENSYGGSGAEQAHEMLIDDYGNFILVGSTTSEDGDIEIAYGVRDYWIVKLCPGGGLIDEKTFGGSLEDWPRAVEQTPDGGYIITGFSNSTDGDISNNLGLYDFWVVKLSPSLEMEWEKSFGGSEDDNAYSVENVNGGGYVIAGSSSSSDVNVTSNSGFRDAWLVRINEVGEIVWQKTMGGTGEDIAYEVLELQSGNFLVAGTSTSFNGDIPLNQGMFDVLLFEINPDGGQVWVQTYGGTLSEEAHSVVENSNGGITILGSSNSTSGDLTFSNGMWDMWLMQIGEPNGIPTEFLSSKVIYPNPTRDFIFLDQMDNSYNGYEIINIAGQIVKAGKVSERVIDVKSLEFGHYFLKLSGGNEPLIIPMLIE